MKIAVLGPSQEALLMTQDLIRLGASVRLFWKPLLETQIEKDLYEQDILVPAPWKNVTKRFLVAGETPKERTRFADLFRVSYEVDPVERVESVQKEQPEVFDKLSQEFMQSLKSQLELFEDFDVVIDGSPSELVRTLGPGGPCVGESRLREGSLYYLDSMDELLKQTQLQEIAIVGDGSVAADALVQLKDWWEKSGGRIFVITNQGNPFATYFQKHSNPQLKAFLKMAQDEHSSHLLKYKEELQIWDELDDFVKVKKVKPSEPIPRIVYFSAHVLTATDQLIDKSRTFLTLETTPWNQPEVDLENNDMDIKTIGVDALIGACGCRRNHARFHGLDLRLTLDGKKALDESGKHPELGFYSLQNSAQRDSIIHHLLTLFSPKESQQ